MVLKLNSTGAVTWQRIFGGRYIDGAFSVGETSDRGCVVAGDTDSFSVGFMGAWVVKLGVGGDIIWDASSGTSTYTMSVTASDSNATTSTTSIAPASSAVVVQDTKVAPRDTTATITTQSSGGEAEQVILIIILVGVIALGLPLVLGAVMLSERTKTHRTTK